MISTARTEGFGRRQVTRGGRQSAATAFLKDAARKNSSSAMPVSHCLEAGAAAEIVQAGAAPDQCAAGGLPGAFACPRS
jgi:hypothetical protein